MIVRSMYGLKYFEADPQPAYFWLGRDAEYVHITWSGQAGLVNNGPMLVK